MGRGTDQRCTLNHRERPHAPPGVLCVIAHSDDAVARFGPSLRWFDRAGIPVHLLEFSVGAHPEPDGAAFGPHPTTALDLVLRCPPELIPAEVLASYVDRVAALTGAGGILTYRRSCDLSSGRALREAVDDVCQRRGVPLWIRDRNPPSPDGAPMRPIKSRRDWQSG